MPARLTALTCLVWLLTESFTVYLVVSSIARRSVDWGNIGWLGFIAFFVTFGLYSRVELRIVI